MITILWNLLFFLIALGILITIHEFGHFWVARKCQVKVERFSIGFGKAIFNKKGQDGTEYTLAMIPLGGYVKMLDERVDEVPEELKAHAFNNRPLWQRTAIVAAGPLANFLFAIFAYWLVLMIGVPSVKPVIGEVTPSSIASEAGLISQMELTEVSGIKTNNWEAVNLQFISHIGEDEMTITVKPNMHAAYTKEHVLDISQWRFDPENESALRTLGIVPFMPEITKKIAMVSKGSAADNAGLNVGDELIAINGYEINVWEDAVEHIRDNPNTALTLTVLREGALTELTLTPDLQSTSNTGYAGIAPKIEEWPDNYQFTLQYGPLAAIPAAFEKTWQMVVLTAEMVKKLITGDVAVKNLSGPISIAKGAGMTADYGLVYFLSFLALIRVNLGIMNLIPLPVLDGGHLLFFAIEAITRRPVSERVQEMGYRLGTAVIVVLMVVALFNDFSRL